MSDRWSEAWDEFERTRMTRDEALKEARRRWGGRADVLRWYGDRVHRVGRWTTNPGGYCEWLGVGATWEEAFAAADKKERGK